MERPAGPEARCAEARRQADALQASAAALKEAGLADRAAELEKEAAEVRKRSEVPPAGRRLDLAQAYLGRCEGRSRKAATAAEAVRKQLSDAEQVQQDADKEVVEAQEQLEKLRAELAPTEADTAMAAPEGEAEERLRTQEAELEQLRAALARAAGERDEALAAGRAQPGPAPPPLASEGGAAVERSLEELEAELKRARAALQEALHEGGADAHDPARLRQLADLSERVGAKRQRTGQG